jgi:PhnB protein
MTHPEDQLIPELIVRDGPAALEFYKRAFGAEEVHRMMTPDGTKLAHAELTVDGHKFFVCDEFDASQGGTCKSPQTLGGTGVRVTLFVDDADATVQRAIAAGAHVNMSVQDMFWGGRYGKIVDPFGHEWGINQQVKEQSHEETQSEADKFFSKRRARA